MVKKVLLFATLATTMTAFAANDQIVGRAANNNNKHTAKAVKAAKWQQVEMSLNDGSNTGKAKAANLNVQWKRPAGQFWGTGIVPAVFEGQYYAFNPLILRPWVDYTFENLSKALGNPTWEIERVNDALTAYEVVTEQTQDLTTSYIWGETPTAPIVKYGSTEYPVEYNKSVPVEPNLITVVASETIGDCFEPGNMLVSSHYYSLYTRMPSDSQGLGAFTGADPYDGMENGYWFGTNNSGYNAMATRFEKPDMPYLLNAVYWNYQYEGAITSEIPLKAYVFKTGNPAKEVESTSGKTFEVLELGELIAEADGVIPVQTSDDEHFSGLVEFDFIETNDVTGAQNKYSLEIEDDIVIVVAGYDGYIGEDAYVTSCMSMDEFDEGYGNLGFLGSLVENEDGTITYSLTAMKNFFQGISLNSTLGVLADVSYPWLTPALENQETSVKLPNEGETTETEQGLQYTLMLLSTSMTDDFEITFDGEEECEWLSVVDVYDEMKADEDGVEEFTGVTGLEFEAAPNPDDESRVCHVKISIPAATYEITFLQGSKADDNAVEVVTANGKVQYFDLTGRRVSNPEKGVYVKVCGNKSEKVIL